MKNRGRSYRTQGVSFTPSLLANAKRRAAEEDRSLSSYLQHLVSRDLRQAGQPPPTIDFATAREPEATHNGK